MQSSDLRVTKATKLVAISLCLMLCQDRVLDTPKIMTQGRAVDTPVFNHQAL